MPHEVNLADPSVESDDADLQRLSHEAFADVSARHQATLVRLRSQMSALRAEALAFAATLDASSGGASR
jgi:hypothetical protein